MSGRYNFSTGKFADGRSWSSVPYRGRNGTLRCHPRAIDWEERYNDEYDSEEERSKVSIKVSREEKEKKEMIEAFKEAEKFAEEPFGEPFGEQSYSLPSIFGESQEVVVQRDKNGNPVVPKAKDCYFSINNNSSFVSTRKPLVILSLIDETLKEMKDFSYIINKEWFNVSGWNINGEQCLRLNPSPDCDIFRSKDEVPSGTPLPEFTANIYEKEDGTYLVNIRREMHGNGLDVCNILSKCKERFGISCDCGYEGCNGCDGKHEFEYFNRYDDE